MKYTEQSMFGIHGRTIVVTGCCGALGADLCPILAQLGAKVACLGHDREKSVRLAQEIVARTGGTARGYAAEIADEQSVASAFAEIFRDFGSIWGLVHTAGITHVRFLREMDIVNWQRVMDVNTKGTLLCDKYAEKYMERQRAGRIINISSPASEQGKPGYTAYTASKAAVDGITKCLSQEWGRMGITVNAVWPSYMPGVMNRSQWGAEADRCEREMAAVNPQGRNCSADLMSGLLVFLLSDSSSFVNGQIIACDGGWNSGHFTKSLPQDHYVTEEAGRPENGQ
jgi:3-oxoacyl-[acyl-carrier protein] reductase